MVTPAPAFQETDPQLIAFADRLIRAKVDSEGDEWWDAEDGLFQKAHRALANRVRFAITGVEPLFTHDEIMVSFAPDLVMSSPDGPYVPGYELQIDSLVPNPEISETPNGSGDWFIRGFEPTEEGVKACIQSLLERGFVWDEQLQAYCDENMGNKSWVNDWMKAGSPGAESAAAPYAQAAREASVDALDQLTSLDQFQRQLKESESLALLFVPASPQMKDGFWRAMGNVGKAYPADLFLVPAGSELSIAFQALDGPSVEGSWAVTVFTRGLRLTGALGEIFEGAYTRVVDEHRLPPARRVLKF